MVIGDDAFALQVSWVKREPSNDNLQLLTVGMQTYSGDSRFSVEFQYPNNWRLRIADTNKSDEGQYECQISTYPPRVITTYFQVHCKLKSIILCSNLNLNFNPIGQWVFDGGG